MSSPFVSSLATGPAGGRLSPARRRREQSHARRPLFWQSTNDRKMSQDIFFSGESASTSFDDPAAISPVQSSGQSELSPVPSAPAVVKKPAAKVAKATEKDLVCPRPGCGKTYKAKSKAYLTKHLIAHNVHDASVRMPTAEDVLLVINDLMFNVVSIMKTEHKLGPNAEMRNEVLSHICDNLTETRWLSFANAMCQPIIKCLTAPTKLLPQNRYQEAQQTLNFTLNEEKIMESLVSKFLCVFPQISVVLGKQLVFRMCILMLDQIQLFIASELRGKKSDPVIIREMSKEEKSEFQLVLSSLLRSFFKKGIQRVTSSSMWRSVCNCLKDSFVLGDFSSKEFLDKALWHNGDEHCIILSDNVVNFFLFVEFSLKHSGENNFRSLDDVLASVYNSREAMEMWFSLTNNYFGDENSAYLMKLMVSAFRDLSMRLEENMKNSAEKEKSIALRTNLKRS